MPFTRQPPRPAEPPARRAPSAEELAIWAQGSRTVRQAHEHTGLGRDELFALMKDGTLRWCVKDLKGTRLIAWADLVRYVASLYAGRTHFRVSSRPA